MKLENIKIYDLEESVKACKYSYAVDTSAVNSDITEIAASPDMLPCHSIKTVLARRSTHFLTGPGTI